jgi:uncharacterized protein
MEQPLLTYPCTWSYRVIGEDKEQMIQEIPQIMGTIRHTISVANLSRQGKYVSINIEATVHNEEERRSVVPLLRNIPKVKMVI